MAALAVLLTVCSFPALSAQDLSYARRIIDTLCSPYFAGRGYVDDGYNKAADFLSEEFNRIGLRNAPHTYPYRQEFTMHVNTFPGRMMVKVEGRELIPGRDYIVSPSSGGIRKKAFRLVYFDSVRAKSAPDNYKNELASIKKKALIYKGNQLDKYLEGAGWPVYQYPSRTLYAESLGAASIQLDTGRLVWSVEAGTGLSYIKTKHPALKIKASSFPAGAATVTIDIEQKIIDYKASNIAGYVYGRKHPDSIILISAHLDHLGKMGSKTYFPGANDNASGVAMMLDLARYYMQPGHQPDYTIAFVAFGGEEAGLIGSRYFTEHPMVALDKIAFMINLDLMANGQDGMMAVNGAVLPHYFHLLDSLNKKGHYLKEIRQRGKAANSDHYWFSERGVKAFFFYLLGAYPYYHDIYDTPGKPTFAGYEGAVRLIRNFIGTVTSGS